MILLRWLGILRWGRHGKPLADFFTSTPLLAVCPGVSDAPSHAFAGCGQYDPPHPFILLLGFLRCVFLSEFPIFQLAPQIVAF